MNLIGLIGFPLSHSFSPLYFSEKFKQLGLENTWKYEAFEMEHIESIVEFIESKPQLKAFNVTIPYKQEILNYCQEIDEAVLQIGAANCIFIKRELGKLHLKASNTDYLGFIKSISHLKPKKALILGNGGAALAVQFALKKLNIEFQTVSRKGLFQYQDLDEHQFIEYDLIVNSTPVGTKGFKEQELPLPYFAIQKHQFFVDLVYNPSETKMMQQFNSKHAKSMNGLSMLHHQADLFWEACLKL